MTNLPPGDNRPPVYWEDGTLVIRASALGTSCMWELVAAGQGHEPGLLPPVLVRAFKEGHDLEPVVIHNLRTRGWQITGAQVEGHLRIAENIIIRYHPDGKCIPQSMPAVPWAFDEHLLEVKALTDDLWCQARDHGTGSTIASYPWQLSTMMHAERLPAIWADINKGRPPDEHGVRPPCNREGQIHIERVAVPPIPLHVIRDKALAIYERVMGDDLLSSDRPCDDPSSWPCRFRHLRPEPEGTMEGGYLVPDRDKEEVDRAIREYLFHKGQADEHKQRADMAKERLLEMAGNHPSLVTDKYVIPLVNSTSTWYDLSEMDKDEKAQYKRSKPIKYIGKVKRLEE